MTAAINIARRNDMTASIHERNDRQRERGLPAGGGNRSDPCDGKPLRHGQDHDDREEAQSQGR